MKESLKGDNTDEIKQKQEELQKAIYDISAKLYQQAQPDAQSSAAGGAQTPSDDGVVDVDYTEVYDNQQ